MHFLKPIAHDSLSRGTSYNIFVKFVIGYVVLGLAAIEVPYFFILCRPFSQYWAMPVENPQCASYFYYCIIQMVFNVSSDLLMLLIPVPFIINVKVPPMKRAMLVGIFSLGIFVILAAVLNKYYNFTGANTTVYMVWDIRETSTSIYVANIMCWWPLLRKMFGWSSFIRNSRYSKSSFGFNPIPEPQETTVGIRLEEPVHARESKLDRADRDPDLKLLEETKDWPLETDN
jgi:hypothetical protein